MRTLTIFGFLWVIFADESTAARLNVPKVLLPYYSNVATNFTLEVKPVDRCYTWTSSRSDVATVLPVSADGAGCSTKAIVTAVSKHPSRMTSIVLAEDRVTGQVLRCDVIVDSVSSIQIVTTTRELYLEDSPEEFQVKAHDAEGNTFSSLEGIAFEWGLISDTDVDQETIVDAHNILRIITFGESSYKTPIHISQMEQRGVQGDRMLVNGIRTGSAKVMVALRDVAYKKTVKPDVVRLIVIANIMLNPSMVYMLLGAEVLYRVDLIGQTTTSEIPMPSEQYYLGVVNSKICTLASETSTITALALGDTEVVLKDRNIKIKEAFRQPSAGVHVVSPGYIGFQVQPGRKWILEVERQYEITVEIFDKDSHKIYPSDNIRVIAKFPPKHFDVLHSSENGTYHIVKTLESGHAQIAGHLTGVLTKDGNLISITPAVKNMQPVEIYDRINVIPPVLVFPWDPTTKISYTYQLKATGGSGNYTWTTSESTIATVNIRGEVTSGSHGWSNVIAKDVKNVDNKGSMEVHVVPPTELVFLPSVVEAEIGSDLQLPLAAYALLNPSKKIIADCSQLPFQVSVGDNNVFQFSRVEVPTVEGSCATLRINAINLGNTEIVVSYKSRNLLLEATVTVAAFLPLKTVNIEGTAVVTVGASLDIVLTGGPQAWVLDPSKSFQTLTVEKPDVVTHEKLTSLGLQKSYHVFHILCTNLAEQSLTVNVGNGETSKNRFPVTAQASIRFACAPPVGLHLAPLLIHPSDLPPCPITPDANHPIPVHSHKDLDINVLVTDSNGRRFDNFSSLAIDWKLSDNSLAMLNDEGMITELQKKSNNIVTYQNVLMRGKNGTVMITATIKRYRRDYFSSQYVRFPEIIDPAISQSLVLMLVEDAVISPSSTHMFNHPENKVKLSIDKGSGYFHIDQGGSDIAKTTYDAKTKKLTVLPLHDGMMVVTAFDLCLASEKRATADVFIAGATTIDVKVVDKVQIYSEIYATVRVLDSDGQPLLAKYFQLMDLKPTVRSNIITLKPFSSSRYTVTYLIYGQILGTTSLTVQAVARTGDLVTSQPRDIQVFPPLRLDPRNITLIIGALFQVTSYGGPQPQSTIEYTIQSTDVAKVSNGGLIEALELGNTTVIGRAVGVDPETGDKIIYSQDSVTVYVVMLYGIRIDAPLSRIQAGIEMPVHAVGMNEHETPFAFGSAIIPLTLTWTINNKEVATLKSVFHKSGIKMAKESNFAMRLAAKQEGHITIRLTATVAADSARQVVDNSLLSDEVQIQVFEKLSVVNPETCDGRVIISPNTETFIKTNRDSTAHKITYKLLGQGQPVISLGPGGQLKSGSVIGQNSLLINSLEEFGINQTLVILVQVKPVAYMMLNVDSTIQTTGLTKLTSVPLGAMLHFTVTYHDDIGQKFHATNTRLKLRPNRFDLLQVSSGVVNSTLIARATEEGQTVLRVWDEANPRISDFINIVVGVAIQPSKMTVTVGDIICFSSPIRSDEGHRGKWKVVGDALQIDSRTGIASATSVGHVQIVYNVSSSLATYSEVSVKPVSRIELLTNSVPFLSNAIGRSKSYSVPVILHDGDIHQTFLIGNNCSELVSEMDVFHESVPFYCEVSMTGSHPDITIADLFHVSAILDTKTGNYACKLSTSTTLEQVAVLSSMDISIRLRAVIPRTDQQSDITSRYVEFDFLPTFHIYSKELLLSNLMPVARIRISAAGRVKRELKVIASDPSMLEVLQPEVDEQSDTILHFPIRLLTKGSATCSLESNNLFIEVACPLTGQKQKVSIKLKLVGQMPAQPGASMPRIESRGDRGWAELVSLIIENYLNLLILVIVTVLCIFLGYYFLSRPRQFQNSDQSTYQARNLIGTPQPGSPTVGYYSPHTPTGIQSPYTNRLWSSGYEFPDRSLSFERKTSPNSRSPYQ
ncbi:nuclear pore membrane glycoprotein 210-like [Tubulanus polymorphus]|uniref:nuclear pore membrane glycoprotein 210-like n=1 Tax=Tubulanus polymorphus TaxID=672921 RepID=UPI003DA1C9E8